MNSSPENLTLQIMCETAEGNSGNVGMNELSHAKAASAHQVSGEYYSFSLLRTIFNSPLGSIM